MSGNNAVLPRNTEPVPVNPFSSHTVAFSHYNNLSAQLPIDPNTGQLVVGGIKEQARQCLANIKTILESIDHSLSDVVRITLFVTDIKDVEQVDEVYKTFFTHYLPTRTVVAVAALPLDAQVQIEALVSNGVGTIPNAPQAGDLIKQVNNTSEAPLDPLSSQTVAFSHYNNLSAQLPLDPKSGQLVVGGVEEQAAQCLKNIKAILESIDVPLDDIVKINIFLTDLADIEAVNRVYSRFFPDSAIARATGYLPARTVIQAAALPMHAQVQIEAVVSHGDGTPPQAVEDRHKIIVEANTTERAPLCSLSTQTVAFSHYNHLSAQLPLDPKTGQLVAGSIKEQTRQCLENIKAIVESIDHALEDVVKVNLFIKDLADIEAINSVYASYFPEGTPARRLVGVSALPEGALIQVDAVVSNAEGTPPLV
ncbi:reactive intermediate/imine deaminase [Marinospirillum celere]|uniref:Reactive intermediate/imine deaminase n=1 Tax=Marinospirillum celere TaxID=1122252 RepID=A0A1I1EJZ3_9GAMM|nr:RidA family protein [Marinospirillum celere]SFB87454.1 reactive intermediate/imine deaminase [Marinospirillum celere]